MRSATPALGFAVVLVLLGCGEEGRAPPPSSLGPGTMQPSGRPDAMSPEDAGMTARDDAGANPSDAGGLSPLATECSTFEPARFLSEDPEVEPVATSTAPEDLEISRALVAWDCGASALRIELSGGSCPNGDGHALVFEFDASAIEAGTIQLGLTPILPEPDHSGIRVRYTRPARLDPEGVWGTCPGATGSLNLRGDAPDTRAFTEWRGTFQLDLSVCEGSGSATQRLVGTFNVETRRALEVACP